MDKKKWIKAYSILVVSILTFAIDVGLSSHSNAADGIRIGVIGPMTGPAADIGRQIKYASILAADEINGEGGILGKKIELYYADDESKPAAGVTEVQKLIEREKIQILTGGLHSDVALATMEVTARYGIPYIISGPVSQSIADKIGKDKDKYAMVFKSDTSSLAYGEAWGVFNNYLEKNNLFKPSVKNYVMIIENTDYGRHVSAACESSMEKLGWKKLFTEIIDLKTVDFYPILSKVKSSQPAIVWSVQSATASGLALIKQFREMKIKALFESTYVSTKPDYVKLVGQDGVGVIAVQCAGILPGRFAKFEKRWGEKPDMVAGIQYDVLYMIREAAKKAGTLEPKKFVDAYKGTRYEGNLGTYVYAPDNHQVLSGLDYLPFLIFQFQEEGKFPLIFPEKYRAANFKMPDWMK